MCSTAEQSEQKRQQSPFSTWAKLSTTSAPFSKQERQDLNEAMAYFLTDSLMPTSLVDRDSFKMVMSLASRGEYKPPGRTKMSELQDNQAMRMRERVRCRCGSTCWPPHALTMFWCLQLKELLSHTKQSRDKNRGCS